MKRKVEYLVYKTESLKESETLNEKLNQVREENHYHYVLTHKGELLQLKDVQKNNADDTYTGLECIHLLMLTPAPGFFNKVAYLFRIIGIGKKLNGILEEFNGATSIPVLHYLDICQSKLSMEIEKLDLKQRELELSIKELHLKSKELHLLLGRISNN